MAEQNLPQPIAAQPGQPQMNPAMPQQQVKPVVKQGNPMPVQPQQPISMQQPPPEQLGQQKQEPVPEKKKSGWKIWLAIALFVIIAIGLGFYFKVI